LGIKPCPGKREISSAIAAAPITTEAIQVSDVLSAPLTCFGAGAVNQAVKAIAISRGYIAPSGLDLVCIPSFIDLTIAGEERTGIRFLVEVR